MSRPVLVIALLLLATLPLTAPAISPGPAQADVEIFLEEGDEESEEDWELEEEEEEAEEEEFETQAAAAPLPPECLLRTAEPSVITRLRSDTLRLTLHYTASTPTKVGVEYWLKGDRGTLQLGSATRRFQRQGVLHLSRHLDAAEAAKVRAARVFIVDLDVPAAPSSCEKYLTLRLAARAPHRSRVTWTER
jgi:hypothetical protein